MVSVRKDHSQAGDRSHLSSEVRPEAESRRSEVTSEVFKNMISEAQ